MGLLSGMAAATVLVMICLLIHYEGLRLISTMVPRLTILPLRARVLGVVCGAFVAHTLEVWVFTGGYYFLADIAKVGGFSIIDPQLMGANGGRAIGTGSIEDYLYFSVVTYTSLGIGDIAPHGASRLLAGVEALLGLLLIAWSASFTYLQMQELWPLHKKRRARGRDNSQDRAESD